MRKSGTTGNLKWKLVKGRLTVKGEGRMPHYSGRDCNLAPWYPYRSSIKAVEIGHGVKSIEYAAFFGCCMTSVTIPDGVAGIGESAFAYCHNLTSVVIPDSVRWISDSAFVGCNSLTSVTVPRSVEMIGSSSFVHCSSLTDINVEQNNRRYSSDGGILFDRYRAVLLRYPEGKKGAYSIPESIVAIGRKAFAYCSHLTSVTIPDSVECIEEAAFSDCDSLTSVTVPDSVKSIGAAAFHGCNNLNTVALPDSVTDVERHTFYSCGRLISVTVPASVNSIGDWAFRNCDSLVSITVPASVTHIGKETFGYCKSLTDITVENDNRHYSSGNGVLFNKDKTVLICYPAGREGDYSIPDGVTCIKDSAFFCCGHLTSVTVPRSVTEIEHWAFSNCSLLTSVINLNPEPQNINSNVFWDIALSKVTLYVPAASVAAYKAAEVWKKFGTVIEHKF
jgi:hypothetical protein